jgi:hypothetical protein
MQWREPRQQPRDSTHTGESKDQDSDISYQGIQEHYTYLPTHKCETLVIRAEGRDSGAVRPVGVPLEETPKLPHLQAHVAEEQPSSNNNIARASFQRNEGAAALRASSALNHLVSGVRYATFPPLQNTEANCELSPAKTELLTDIQTPDAQSACPPPRPTPGGKNFSSPNAAAGPAELKPYTIRFS